MEFVLHVLMNCLEDDLNFHSIDQVPNLWNDIDWCVLSNHLLLSGDGNPECRIEVMNHDYSMDMEIQFLDELRYSSLLEEEETNVH